jgi:hypothetical protein
MLLHLALAPMRLHFDAAPWINVNPVFLRTISVKLLQKVMRIISNEEV